MLNTLSLITPNTIMEEQIKEFLKNELSIQLDLDNENNLVVSLILSDETIAKDSINLNFIIN